MKVEDSRVSTNPDNITDSVKNTPPLNVKDGNKVFGKKWTSEEEDALLENLAQNLDYAQIAEKHERTVGSIGLKVKELAYKLSKSGVSVLDIVTKTKLTKEEIEQYINKKNTSMEKKVEKKVSKSNKQPSDISTELANINKSIDKLTSLVQSMLKK